MPSASTLAIPYLSVQDPKIQMAGKGAPRSTVFGVLGRLPKNEEHVGVKSLGGRSFCTIAPADFHVETELSDNDHRLLRNIHNALGVDDATFRPILDLALGTALRGDVRSREDTVHWTQTGGGKRTMEHVSPDSPDSRMLVTMDLMRLLMARRLSTTLALQLGPVTVTITLMRCPPHVFHSVLAPRDPAALRLRFRGTITDSAILLMGPLPKG
jgi:hypothetical protein